MAINLDRGEIALLAKILEEALDQTRSEVRHTQDLDYKESLKERETLIRGLLIKLAG
jgi:hypothetical protein